MTLFELIIIIYVPAFFGMMIYKLTHSPFIDTFISPALPSSYYFISNKKYRLIPRIIVGVVFQIVFLPLDAFMVLVFGLLLLIVAIFSFVKWILLKPEERGSLYED